MAADVEAKENLWKLLGVRADDTGSTGTSGPAETLYMAHGQPMGGESIFQITLRRKIERYVGLMAAYFKCVESERAPLQLGQLPAGRQVRGAGNCTFPRVQGIRRLSKDGGIAAFSP